MARIEKTVFVSYRRTDEPWGLAIFQDLTQHGYDVFIDYDGIASGNFETAILENIKARAHFLVLLTPTALERCADPKDWMRREIEAALDSQRNIVPVMLAGFDFGTPATASQLIGKLAALKKYNGLEIPRGYFSPAMERLRNKFLSVSLDTVLHPASLSAQQAATEQKGKAARALADEHRKGEDEQPRNAAQAKAARQAREEERKREEEANARRNAEEERHQREAEAKRQAEEQQKQEQEERLLRETQAKRRAEDDVLQGIADGKKQAQEERVRREADRAEQRRREKEERNRHEQQARELQATRKADEERKQTEERRQKKLFTTESRRQPGKEPGVGTPLWKIISFPWHPVETIRQARLLTLIAVICFVAIALFGAVVAMGSFFSPNATDWIWILMWTGIFLFFGCCSLGTYFNSRMAALLGFAGVLLPFIFLFCAFVVSPPPDDITKWQVLAIVVVLFFLSWSTSDGIRGTWAISRLRGAAGKPLSPIAS
jgi:hypothetical protein